MADSFEVILELIVGFRAGKPLPPPQSEAVLLRERALECVERWSEKYADLYPEASQLHCISADFGKLASSVIHHLALLQIGLGHRYLKENLKMQFPEIRARAAAREAEAAARQVSHAAVRFNRTAGDR